MCGRYTLDVSATSLAEAFGLAPIGFRVERHWNISPGQHIIVVRPDRGGRVADVARWGLVPVWSRDPNQGPMPFNARAETAAQKPTFRDAFRHRRCLVPATGFYEWQKDGRSSQPYLIRTRERGVFAFAGLWEDWQGPAGVLRTACILTLPPNAFMAQLHNRMPAVLPQEAWPTWLDPGTEPESLSHLLSMGVGQPLNAWPVGPAVGSVQNEGLELAVPIGEALTRAGEGEADPPS